MAKLVIDEKYCKGCGLCLGACPKGLLQLDSQVNRLGFSPAVISEGNLKKCTSCALCGQMCPDAAIRIQKEEE